MPAPVVWTPSSPPARADIEAIAVDRRRVEISPDLLRALDDSHRTLVRALEAGGPVYGVTTGQGYLADRPLTPQEATRHQHDLLLGRAVGSAPWLSRGEARALVAVRLARFASTRAGVSAGLCRFLADRLNDDFVPAVPRAGAGCSGEVIPLAHAFQAILGIGRVIDASGSLIDAAAALGERGVAPYAPGPKEGIALLAGSPGVTALAILRCRETARIARLQLAGAACAIDAANVPLAAVSVAAGRHSADPLLRDVLERLDALLAGSDADRPGSQGPVSFRVAPQMAAHLARAIGRLGEDADRALASGDDSPALVDGAFVSTGAFHEIDLAAGMDAATAALARAAETSAQRVHRLLDGRFTGLPDQLTPVPGPRCGLVVLHKRAVAAIHELRRLAAPASLGVMDTSLGQEDVQTFGFAAADGLRRAQELALEVLAIELLTARQAWSLRARPPAPGLAALADPLQDLIAPVVEDRPLGDDVDRVTQLLRGLD